MDKLNISVGEWVRTIPLVNLEEGSYIVQVEEITDEYIITNTRHAYNFEGYEYFGDCCYSKIVKLTENEEREMEIDSVYQRIKNTYKFLTYETAVKIREILEGVK